MRSHGRRSIVIAGAVIALAGSFAVAAAALTPTDPLGTHPAYEALNLPAAWDVTAGSPEVVVAIVDSGVEAAHPDLAGSVRPGYDFVERDDVAAPVDGHGTGVAAAAAARAENGIGGVGACFRCTVLPLQVVGPDGIALNVHIAEAIDYAVDHRAAVVNVSLVGPNSPPELERAITRARAAGILVVAAAGNEGRDIPRFPAATRGAISVAASTYDGRRAGFSNYGTWVKFAAPECAPIAVLGGGSGVGCGTSMAAPLVAGIIALMRTQAPYATSDEIESSLARASRFVSDTRYGVPDAAAALHDVGSPQPRLRPVVLGQPAVGRSLEASAASGSGRAPKSRTSGSAVARASARRSQARRPRRTCRSPAMRGAEFA
jgi:subtilisin family serine protease